jgi:hypothetical protein
MLCDKLPSRGRLSQNGIDTPDDDFHSKSKILLAQESNAIFPAVMSKDKYMTFDMLFYFSHCTKTYHLNHL